MGRSQRLLLVQSSRNREPSCRNVPNSLIMKIQDGRGNHIEFQKNVSIFELDEDISAKFGGQMHHGHASW